MDFNDFAALHRPGQPLLLVNAWDGASARFLYSSGNPVIGTTSLGTAYSAGLPDGEGQTFTAVLALVEQCTRQGIPVSADIENGFSDSAEEVLNYAREIHAAGAIGINIEDGLPNQTLIPLESAAERIRIISSHIPNLFVNARTDPYWVKDDSPDAEKFHVATRRAQAYREAGAHGIFVPGAAKQETIRALVSEIPAPLNVLCQPGGLSLHELAGAGVARVSTGSFLFRHSLGSLGSAVDSLRADGAMALDRVPTYGELNAHS